MSFDEERRHDKLRLLELCIDVAHDEVVGVGRLVTKANKSIDKPDRKSSLWKKVSKAEGFRQRFLRDFNCTAIS